MYIDKRTNQNGRIQRISNFGRCALVGFCQRILYFIVYRTMYDQPSGRCTPLTCSAYRPKNNSRDGHFKIGMLRHDDGIVTTQFQDSFAQPFCDQLRYPLSYFG